MFVNLLYAPHSQTLSRNLLYTYAFMAIHRVKWRHSTLWSRYDIHVVGHVVDYFVKLTGKDLTRYLNKNW